MTATDSQIERIGNRFAQTLYEYFKHDGVIRSHGPNIWQRLRHENAAIHFKEGHGNLCNSHEYCDANVFILEAFEDVMGREAEVGDEVDMGIMGEAWDKATKAYLCAECEPKAHDPILPDSPCCPGAFLKGGEDCVYCRNCKETC